MEKKSKPDFPVLLAEVKKSGKLPEKLCTVIGAFHGSYVDAVGSSYIEETNRIFSHFLDLVLKQVEDPYEFEPFHKKIREPIDYYKFGCEFLLPLVDLAHSTIRGEKNIQFATELVEQGDNVVFFANHQIEADPQAISILFEKPFPKLADEMIFVAGERVVVDPLAVPFSLGCNLLCIYSKRYIDHPPEKKHDKQIHNKKTMQLMSALLTEGGKCIYVAPSGGRDRKGPDGKIEIAPFDPRSVEMFYLMAKRAKKKTHFFPMSLQTYEVLPPPETVQVELGEKRSTKRAPIHISVGPEIDMEHFPGSDISEKQVRRKARSDYIWHLVNADYRTLSE